MVWAAGIEPGSAVKFPDNRENYRERAWKAPVLEISPSIRSQDRVLRRKFPKRQNREFAPAEQGKLRGYQVSSLRADALKKLEPFRLDGVVEKIACPFLLLHGEGDEQISLALAQHCFDRVGSKTKTLKVFTREEGGYHHCQIDNVSIGIAYMWDWLETILQPA